jgi:drug/metabolite transporter (DMT)-like permease
LTFEYSLYAGINQGIISTMFAFNSVFLSIFGWLIFKEKANNIQITGMIMLVSSAVLYGVSGGKSTDISDESENHVAAYVPILLALACTFYLMIRSLALKAF